MYNQLRLASFPLWLVAQHSNFSNASTGLLACPVLTSGIHPLGQSNVARHCSRLPISMHNTGAHKLVSSGVPHLPYLGATPLSFSHRSIARLIGGLNLRLSRQADPPPLFPSCD